MSKLIQLLQSKLCRSDALLRSFPITNNGYLTLKSIKIQGTLF